MPTWMKKTYYKSLQVKKKSHIKIKQIQCLQISASLCIVRMNEILSKTYHKAEVWVAQMSLGPPSIEEECLNWSLGGK